jgi:hypothetical protein
MNLALKKQLNLRWGVNSFGVYARLRIYGLDLAQGRAAEMDELSKGIARGGFISKTRRGRE